MMFDFGKNINNALGETFQTISGIGSAFAGAGFAAKEFNRSADKIAKVFGIFFAPRYVGKKRSIFKSDRNLWGDECYMRSRKINTNGETLEEAQARNASTHTSSSGSACGRSSTSSSTSSSSSTTSTMRTR